MLRNIWMWRTVVVVLLSAAPLVCVDRDCAQSTVELRVDAKRVENSISPNLYGQFVEDFFEDVSGPLWDELIRDRGFEQSPDEIGLPRYWDREPDDRNHDPAMRFFWDDAEALAPSPEMPGARPGHSLRVDVQDDQWDTAWPRGISQKRIDVRKGISYRGHLWLRTEGFQGFVTVALQQDETGGRTYARRDLPVHAANWTKYEFELTPRTEDPHAKFSILIHGHGRIWIDGVSLMPSDTTAGARADVFRDIKALRPFSIRWPGGNVAQNYHWWWGVGDRDKRPAWIDHAWWQELKNSDFGTDEYLALSRELGSQPSIVVNVEGDGATAAEAAAWVEYVNGPADSKWGRLRAKNGHPEPYHVKYWEVGNEIFGPWEIGHTDAATYARNVNRYVAAMRAVDPTIEIIACGSEDMAWNRELLRTAGANIDLIAIHHYYGDKEAGGDVGKILARPEFYGQFYSQLRQAIHKLSPTHDIKVTVNEWNTAMPLSHEESLLSGVYAGLMMNQFERNGDLINSSAVSDMVNGWMGGIVQSAKDGRLYVTPVYLVNRLYNEHLGEVRVFSDLNSAGASPPDGSSTLDAVVSRARGGKEMIFKLVNRSASEATTVHVHVTGATLGNTGSIATVTGPSLDSTNTFEDPQNVREIDGRVGTGSQFTVTLPRASISVLTVPIH